MVNNIIPSVAPETGPEERVSLGSFPTGSTQWDELLKRMVQDKAQRPEVAAFSSSV
jgi:hypothetical protein